MESVVYVDVLLALNYIINTLLLRCTAKIAGISPKRRKIVAAALLGSTGSLTIFLPFMGFFWSLLVKLLLSASMVLAAFGFVHIRRFCRVWFCFFAVSFCLAGVMLGIWMLLSPRGMLYYNGVVYFHISFGMLITTSFAAYLLLSLAQRLRESARPPKSLYDIRVTFRGKSAELRGLVDSGNHLREPFSGLPVMVCRLDDVSVLLPEALVQELRRGSLAAEAFSAHNIPVRLIPWQGVAGGGLLPAFHPDLLRLSHAGEVWHIERAYVALSAQSIGNADYNAILSPEFIGTKNVDGGENNENGLPGKGVEPVSRKARPPFAARADLLHQRTRHAPPAPDAR